MVTLVTGATGFVGGHLARRLIARGDKVRLVVRDASRAEEFARAGAEIVVGDLLDAAIVGHAIAGCDTVCHIAAQMLKPGVPRKQYMRANVEATRNLVEAATAAGVSRFVMASTAGVYGRLKTPVDETSPLSLSSAYRESKGMAEDVCRNAHRTAGLPVVIARLSPMIGAGSTSYVGLPRSLQKGGSRAVGTGRNLDHITPIEDIVEGLIGCIDTPSIEGRTYLLAGDTAAPTGEIIGMFVEALGAPQPVGHLPDIPYHLYTVFCEKVYAWFKVDLPGSYRYAFFLANKTLRTGKAKAELGFAPSGSLREAVHAAVASYRRDGLV